MAKQQKKKTVSVGFDIKNTLKKYCFVILGLGFALSAAAFIISFTIENQAWITALQVFGSLMAGAVFSGVMQILLLGEFNKHDIKVAIRPDLNNLEEVLLEQIQDIVPRITTETLSSIDDIRTNVSDAARFMEKGIDVLSGANRTGIVNIFPNRYEPVSDVKGPTVIDEISREIQDEQTSISMMGISLGDFFLDRGQLNKIFKKVIDEKNASEGRKFRAMIVNPKCPQLWERARWEAEEGEAYMIDDDFYASTTFIETDGAAKIAKRLCRDGKAIEVKTYEQAPVAFVLLTSRYLFLEPYSYASRGGGGVPVFQIKAGSNLYKYYESHFNRIWEKAEPISSYNPLGRTNFNPAGGPTIP